MIACVYLDSGGVWDMVAKFSLEGFLGTIFKWLLRTIGLAYVCCSNFRKSCTQE